MSSRNCPHCKNKVKIDGDGTYKCPFCKKTFQVKGKVVSIIKNTKDEENKMLNSKKELIAWSFSLFALLFGLVSIMENILIGLGMIFASLLTLPPIYKIFSKKIKIRFGYVCLISLISFCILFILFAISLPDEEYSGSSDIQEQQSEKTSDLSTLLNQTKALINDFNENLTIASNYDIDVSEYSNIDSLEVSDNSSYKEIEEVLGLVTKYKDDLENRIDEAENKTYKVVAVVDGDTIKIEYKGSVESVRLIGIDTPETVHPNEPVGCFGEEASNKMKELVSEKSVRIMFDSSQGSQDKYGRLLLYIWVGDISVNKKMIEDGYAYEYTYSTPYIYQKDFKEAQASAKSLEKGLWGDVCACEKKELSRTCSSCKIASVKYQDWDCSTFTKSVSDTSCTSGCTTSTPTPSPTYVCDCSKTCTQISTCAEAYYQLNTCGCSRRDGDKDGIPCDSMCQ